MRHRALRRRGAAIAAAVAIALASTDAAAKAQAVALGPDAYESRLFQLVNAERVRHGLRRLAPGRCASGFAGGWVERIAAERRLRHQSVRKVLGACEARRAAENVAMGDITPEAMVRMWMRSRGHRANILDPRLTHAAIGAKRAKNGDWYAVQVFVGY